MSAAEAGSAGRRDVGEQLVVGVLVPVADPDLGDLPVVDPVHDDAVDVDRAVAPRDPPMDEARGVRVAGQDVVDAEVLELPAVSWKIRV